jgi:hypothetical protein
MPAVLHTCQKRHITTIIAKHIPALLHTCQNSRCISIKEYQNFTLCIQTSKVIIYFNSLVDVVYFKSDPPFHIMPPIGTRPQIHHVKLDTRCIYYESPYSRIGAVTSLLSHVWRYAKFETVKLVHENNLDTDMVETALREAHGYNLEIDWKVVSKTRLASTNHGL